VLCKSTADIRAALQDSDPRRHALLEQALLGHTLDITGLLSDRAGLFGRGWLTLLEELGLEGAEAMNALVEVANVLQGPSGTLAIWKAFTSVLEVPDRTVVGEPKEQISHSASFREWAAETRDRLRSEGIEDDEPYRLLAGAGAMGMSNSDMSNFACMVQAWSDGMEEGGEAALDAAGWAASTTDAIESASEIVAEDRLERGCRTIKAREKAREDAKASALDRRERLLGDKTQHHGAEGRERLRRSIAKLKLRQTRARTTTKKQKQTKVREDTVVAEVETCADDAQATMSSARTATRARAMRHAEDQDPRPEARSLRKRRPPVAGSTGQPTSRARNETADDRATAVQQQRRKAADSRAASALNAPQGNSVAKAAQHPGPAAGSSTKRRAQDSDAAQEQTSKRRTTTRPTAGAGKRAATVQAAPEGDRAKRARTREERATGTTIKEPD
jgi:hypothetical protein